MATLGNFAIFINLLCWVFPEPLNCFVGVPTSIQCAVLSLSCTFPQPKELISGELISGEFSVFGKTLNFIKVLEIHTLHGVY